MLFYLGRWWQQEALLNRAEELAACSQAKNYFRQSIDRFRQAQRPDLVAKFINPLAEILQKLQAWDELEAIALVALELHQTYPVAFGETRDYGFLAEVALARTRGEAGKDYAQKALQCLPDFGENAGENAGEDAGEANTGEASANFSAYFNVAQHYLGWGLLLLARSQEQLGNIEEAIANLERGREESHPLYNPLVYIEILEKLRSLYFKEGQYLQAFEAKQQKEAIEHRFGLRAFIGAGRLEPQLEASNLAPAFAAGEKIASEIAASGRQQDVDRLVARMDRVDLKLTIIHGQSGVGKSSLVQAGLIPALQQQTIGARKVLPVLQQVYNNWLPVLSRCLGDALGKAIPASPEAILQQLQENGDRNLLTVLIFDQFEELVFDCQNQSQRLPFYEFLRQCLNVPYLKVVLSLREDYLHYLLECNDRLVSLDAVNNNILDKKIIYYLGNFSPADASSVISSLTERSQFRLQPALIQELVRDLAGELNEVRPIELQVVGVQLQADNITTLESYRESGPKQRLVGKFLQDVVQYCGRENESMAKLFLYLLTDENNTRPLKTRADLELELETKPEALDLILDVFVRSGLVLKQPAFPEDRYQLVHDYLVELVRKQPESAPLFAELEKERRQHNLTEHQLVKTQQQQLRAAGRARNTLAGLLASVACFAAVATIGVINTYLTALTLSSADNEELDRVVSALRLGKQFKQLSIAALPETRLRVLTELNHALARVRHVNRLEGHRESVTWATFSPDGKMLATASEDKTARIWKLDGTLLHTLEGHTDSVTSISFSPDGKLLASASEDRKIKLWNLKGELLHTFEGHSGSVTRVAFSPDAKTLASASEDKTVKVWSIEGKNIVTLNVQSEGISSVSFSPDGKTIATASTNDFVILWNLKGEKIVTIDSYGAKEVYFNIDGSIQVIRDYISTRFNYNGKKINIRLGIKGRSYGVSRSHDYNKAINGKTVIIYKSFRKDKYLLFGKKGMITNGKLFAISNHTNQVEILQHDGELLTTLLADGSVISFSPDKKTVMTGSAEDEIGLWSLDGGETGLRVRTGSIIDTKFSPDGRIVALVLHDKTVKLWHRDNSKIVTLSGHKDRVEEIYFSPDSKTIASIDHENVIKLWRTTDGNLIATLPAYTEIKGLIFSPDSQILATTEDDNSVKLWRTSDGDLVATLPGYADEIYSVTFSPDSQMLATTGDDTAVKLWKVDGTLVKVLLGHAAPVAEVGFSPDGQTLASVSEAIQPGIREIKLWHREGEPLDKTVDDFSILRAHFVPEKPIIASIHWSDEIKLWDFGGNLVQTFKGHYLKATSFSLSPDGQRVAADTSDNTIKIWQRGRSEPIETKHRHSNQIKTMSFSPDGNKIVSASYDQTVRLWQSNDGKLIKELEDNINGEVKQVNFSTNGEIVALISSINLQYQRYDYAVKFWSASGEIIQEKKGHSRASSSNLAFSPDFRTVAFVNKDDSLKLWRIDDGKLLATFKGHQDWINNASFSQDGEFVVSASDDRTIKIWDSNNGELLRNIAAHDDAVNSARFSPDGEMIVSASNDKTVKLWNRRDGSLIRTFEGHTDRVTSATFSPDGKTIVSGGNDNTLRFWRVSDGRETRKIPIYYDSNIIWDFRLKKTLVKDINFTLDGKIIAISGDDDRPVKLHILNWFDGIWFKETELYPVNSFSEEPIQPGGDVIAVTSPNGMLVLSLGIDDTIERACDWARDYLQNNVNVKESDKRLCDDVGTKKKGN